jgi:hypothetical protein
LNDDNFILVHYDLIESKMAYFKIYNDRKHGELLAKNAYIFKGEIYFGKKIREY